MNEKIPKYLVAGVIVAIAVRLMEEYNPDYAWVFVIAVLLMIMATNPAAKQALSALISFLEQKR